MIDRRAFLSLSGAAAIGLALPSRVGARGRPRAPTIRMWSVASGAAVGFDPIGLAVPPGTEIRFVLDSGVHSATAYDARLHDHPTRAPAGARAWDSGILVEPGASFRVSLDVPGVHDFYCRPHEAAGMVGRIVVGAPGKDFAIPSWTRPGRHPEGPLPPPAAIAAFPAVDRIAREGVVRNPPPTDSPNPGDSR